MTLEFFDQIEHYKLQNIDAINALDENELVQLNNIIEEAMSNDNSIYMAGNGGSYATASHAVCDFSKGINLKNKSKLRVYCLLDSIPTLTAWANDFDYQSALANTLDIYQKPNDILFLISGSGNSVNLIEAAKKARELGNKVISITGFDGGQIRKISDFNINVKSDDMQVIENLHLLIIHLIFKMDKHSDKE
jgi:D-sedoheptulose 7-phosphate isomerase